MNTLANYAINKLRKKLDQECIDGNIGTSERILSVVAGGLIISMGIKKIIKHPITALSGVTLGGALVYRGVTGRCTIKSVVDNMSEEKDEVTLIEHRYFVK